MDIKLLNKLKHNFKCLFVVLSLFFIIPNINAQCAGIDNVITVCDILDPSSASVDLFNVLGNDAIAGGIWIDNSKSGGLNETTGILNAQKIRKSGVYSYTYSVKNGICVDTATISVTIGGYTGITSSNVSVCQNSLFNLFHAFNGLFVNPQSNGKWIDNNATGALDLNVFNTRLVPPGTYLFTYIIPAIDTCPEKSSVVKVTVYPLPNSGTPQDLILCNTDDLSPYRNLDLHSRLNGQDLGGIWSESNTSELSGPLDTSIDVQNIYNNFGAGTYNFTYTVLPSNPICDPSSSKVSIIIEDLLDFTGATLQVNSDICENEISTATYKAVLTKGSHSIPNGSYEVTYKIDGKSSSLTQSTTAFFNAGILSFPIDKTNFSQVDDYTISVTKIIKTDSYGACNNNIGIISDELHIHPLPQINRATITVAPVCKGLNANVEISGNTNLTNGNYSIIYNLSGKNTAVSQQAMLTVSNGLANFSILSGLIPIVGNSTISILNITNLTTGCTNTSTLATAFTVKALPVVSDIKLEIKSVCQNQDALVLLSELGTMTNITLNYKLEGANVLLDQNITLVVDSGKTSFVIPTIAIANAGQTKLVLNFLTDNVNGCGAIITDLTKDFTIDPLPIQPANNRFVFCKNENKTIASLMLNDPKYQWFDSLSSTNKLNSNTPLTTNIYYVKEVNTITGCESARATIDVIVNELETPILKQDGQIFCGLDKPTVQNLSNNAITNGVVVWFDAAENGNQLPLTTLLKEGLTYYGFNFSNDTNCYSNGIEVTVSLSNCDVTPDFSIPDGFSPNGDGVNDTFRISKIDFIYPNYTLEIYNRNGNLLFTGNKNKPEWDGRNSDFKIGINGVAPNGVYFYILYFNKDNKKPTQGKLYLNR